LKTKPKISLRDSAHTLSEVDFVNESRKHVSVLKVEVVMWAKHICRYDRCELTSVLLVICSILNIYHSLGVRIAEIGAVWRAVVNL